MNNGLDALLRPKSIAVVGASPHEGKIGNILFRQILKGDFRVYPVNAKGANICGLPSFRTIMDLPETPDLAVLAVPAEATITEVADCVKRGVKAVIAIAGGFSEAGEAGRELERELKRTIKGGITRVLGPNTLGVMVPAIGLDTVFLSPERFSRPSPGSVALISQSGSAALGEIDAASPYGVAISIFVGLGNRLDIDENELLRHIASDPATRVIALYLESFANPGDFLELCRDVVPDKPVVLLRAGRSEAGARAVQLHTGALAGSDRVTDGVLHQVGIRRVYDAEELLDISQALAYPHPVSGRRVAILTNGGGFGIVAADYIESKDRGIASSLAQLAPETTKRLESIALPFAALRNPIDLTASVTNEMFGAALEILQDDPGIDLIFCCFGYQPPGMDSSLTDTLCYWGSHGRKPMVVSLVGAKTAIPAIRQLVAAGVPSYPSIWRGVRAIDAMAYRGEQLRQLSRRAALNPAKTAGDTTTLSRFNPGTPLSEDEVKALLRARGIATPRSIVLEKGVLPPSLPLAYPLVLKVRSSTILHKTELGGVILDLRDRQQLENAVGEMQRRFPGEDLLVEEMERKGVELIVGLTADPTFGPSIMCGIGGVLAELYQDVTFRRVPIDRIDADEMLAKLKGHALLEGFRGIKASREAVVDLLLKVSSLGEELRGAIDQLDLNPVIVHEDRAVVVDAKLLWRQPCPGGSVG